MTSKIVAFSKDRSLVMSPAEFKATLKELGYTQAEFADYIGSNLRTVNDWGSETPKNAGKIKGELRLGPPTYIVRLLRNMQRGHIDKAPISPKLDDAITALSPAVSAIMGNATVKEWPAELAAEAIAYLADLYAHPERMEVKRKAS